MSFEEDRKSKYVGKILEEMLEIGSSSGDETELLGYLEEKCRNMGLHIDYQKVIGVRYNLVVNPLLEPELIITAHVDTVPETIDGNTCRHEIVEGRYYGRGAADVKGGMAALLGAMEELFNSENPLQEIPPVTFVFTVDEEKEGRGSEEMAKLNGRSAVVIEPTDLKICTAQTGSVMLELDVYGKSAHGGEFEGGKNAIWRAFEILKRINKTSVVNDYHPLIGYGGYNVQMIDGGSDEMVVPNKCRLHLDFRVLPNQEPSEVQTVVDDAVDEYEDYDSKWVEVSGCYEISESEPIVELMKSSYTKALGESPVVGGIRSWTDAEHLYINGTKSIVFGPGSLVVSHTEEEYIELEEVVRAASIFEELISSAGKLKKM